MSRPCHVLRVFTRGNDGGNHLGVIVDAIALSADRMQAIATDLGFSETVFIDWTDTTDHPKVRIFTPADELPFAGHPLVGASWVLSMLGPRPTYGIHTGVGPVEFAVDGDVVSVSCDIEIADLDDDVAAVAAAAGLPEPISTMRLGLPKEYLIAEYEAFDDVAGMVPDMEALTGRFGFLAYARNDDRVKVRFFAPGTAVPEDPATGSAAVALAHGFMRRGEGTGAVTITQGDEIGHPSTIDLAWDTDRVTIGGTVRRDEVVLVD